MTNTTTQPRVSEQADEQALFEAWAKRQGHDVVSRLETGGKFYVSSFTRHAWEIWQACAALAQQSAERAAGGELPPLPEMDSLADVEHAQNTPADWDDDYRNTWRKLQVALRNKMQWRTYALQLREAVNAARAAHPGDAPAGGKAVRDGE